MAFRAINELTPNAHLQHLLREVAKTKKRDLADQIDEVLPNLPSYLGDQIDGVRVIGNFAAHPTKSTTTGEIINVEPGEAEWLLDTLEMAFDFYLVQPALRQKKRDDINATLTKAGKPAQHFLDAHNRASDLLRGRFQARMKQPMPWVAFIGENREMVGVEQDHEGACRFFLLRGRARGRSAARILRPSSKICFMRSSPVKAPRVRRQSLARPIPAYLTSKTPTCFSSAATRSSSVARDMTGLLHQGKRHRDHCRGSDDAKQENPGLASFCAYGHPDDKLTSNFCPSASAHLCSVASVGFSILPVSSRDRAGAAIPLRSATSASVSPWLSRSALEGKLVSVHFSPILLPEMNCHQPSLAFDAQVDLPVY